MLSYKPCIAAKHHRTPFPTNNRAGNAKAPMHLLHMDLCQLFAAPKNGHIWFPNKYKCRLFRHEF
jgi:hypothetical protein